jgi:PEP-CTERM motif
MTDVFMSGMTTLRNQYCGLRASFWAAVCAAASLMLLGSGAAFAQAVWSADASGEWFVGTNWSGGPPPFGYPDLATSASIIDGTSTVTILNTGQGAAEVANLTIDMGNGLDISSGPMNNSVLLMSGASLFNAGAISISSTSTTTPAALELESSTVLNGGGTVTMSGAPAFIENFESTKITLTTDNTIQGSGQIGAGGGPLSLINSGTVDANQSGQTLYLNGGVFGANTGTLEATNGGILTIDNSFNNKGGVIIANGSGSTVNVNGVTIQGGTLTTESGGFMGTAGGDGRSILDGSTEGAITLSANSTYTTAGGSATGIEGTITLDAGSNMAIGTASSPSGTLQLLSNTTIGGHGTVTMTGTSAFIESGTVASQTLTNEATIQGYGQIGADTDLNLTNKGTLDANVSGETLYFNGSGLLNNGTVTVAGGATLNVQLTAFVQSKAAGGATPVTNVEGTLDVPSGFSLEGGMLEGTGTVDGAVDNTGGVVSPGDAPGTLTIDGAYTQGSGGAFDAVVDSLSVYSQLDVTGLATLGGLLDLTSKFPLVTGDSFTIMELGSVTGDFSSFMYDGSTCTGGAGDTWSCANGAEFALVFNGPGTVDLDLNVLKPGTPTVPEPSTWAMMIVGFAGFGFLFARQRRAAIVA